jgi:UDP-N-acetylmuramyl pentapeptide synthase
VLNADDPRVAGMARDTSASVVTYGRAPGARVRAAGDVAEDASGLAFTLEVDGDRRRVTLAFAGRHNVTNALAAAAAGVALGLPLDDVVRGLAAATPVKGRCVWRQAGPVRVLDDTYNANPVSVAAALDTAVAGIQTTGPDAPLGLSRSGSRLVAVLGDMLELGALTEEAHREVGRRVAALGAAAFIGVGRHMGVAVEAARQAGLTDARQATTFEDTVAELLKRVEPGDVVLVKGSRGMRMERVADALVARLTRAEPGPEA